MMTDRYALFQNGEFVETRERKERPENIPHKNVEWYPVGDKREGSKREWIIENDYAIEIVLPAPKPEPRREGTWLEFKALFTPQEQRALAGAAMSNVDVKLFYDDAVAENWIDLKSPRVIAGFEFMSSAGLLTKDRKDEILASDFDAQGK